MHVRTFSVLARLGLLLCVAALLIGALPAMPVSAQSGGVTVSNGNDDGSGSLRAVIAAAGDGATITFGSGVTTVTLASPIAIDKNLTINGSGRQIVITSGSSRIFQVGSYDPNTATGTSVNVLIENLAITAGNEFRAEPAPEEPADPTMPGFGGGVMVSKGSKLTLTNVTMTGNKATHGGAIANFGTLNLLNTTIADNTAAEAGAGIFTDSADVTDPAPVSAVLVNNSILFRNTLDNATPSNCYTEQATVASAVTLNAYNVLGDVDPSCTIIEKTANNVVGTSDAGLGTITGPNPVYYPLLSGSPAKNFIPVGTDSFNGAPTTDQRGYKRPSGTAALFASDNLVDAGAAEMTYTSAISPAMEAGNISRTTKVTAAGSAPLSASSVTAKTLNVMSGFTGQQTGSYASVSGVATFTPSFPAPLTSFYAGDLVQVTATSGLLDTNGLPGLSKPMTWEFRTATKAGPGLNRAYSATGTSGGGNSFDIAMALINPVTEDPYLDIAVAQSTYISVKRNNYYGDFSWAQSVKIASNDIVAVNFGDFNGDGLADMLATCASQEVVFFNNGDGSYMTVTPVAFSTGGTSMKDAAVADVDSDGDQDIVVVGTSSNRVYFNDGTGVFDTVNFKTFTASSGTTSISMADLDLDGDLDAIVSTTGSSPANKVWKNDGKGVFTNTSSNNFGGANTFVTTGDLNKDGYPDAVTTGNGTHTGVWLNDKTGKFLPETTLTTGTQATGAGLGDLDGDGDLDLVITNTYRAGASNLETVWTNNGSGVFAPAAVPTLDANVETMAVVMGDVNNDGRIDAVFANTNTTAGGGVSDEVTFLNDTRPVMAPINIPGMEDTELPIDPTVFSTAYTDLPENDPLVKVRFEAPLPDAATYGVLYQGTGLNMQPVTSGKDYTLTQLASLKFVPASNFFGTVAYSISATDGGFWSLPSAMNLNIANKDDAPMWKGTPPNMDVPEMQPLSIDLPSYVSDIDNDPVSLTYTFSSTPPSAGMSIDQTTKAFKWNPAEEEGAGTYVITFWVADSNPKVQAPGTVTIKVNEVNRAPDFTPVPPQTVDEMQTLTFQVAAVDHDNTAQTVSYSIVGSLPIGSNWDPDTLTFRWTPTEAQGPMNTSVTFRATDSEGLYADMVVPITVNEDNTLPVFVPVGAQQVNEGSPITITVIAHDDVDQPTQTLTYSMASKPDNATFDPALRKFSWTPSEEQGPGDVTVIFRVNDGYDNVDMPVTITVFEVNQAPVWTQTPAQTVDEHKALAFTVVAKDPDIPGQDLTYAAVASTLPDGATFDPLNQKFTWTPGEEQGGGDYYVKFNVTDKVIPQPVEMTVKITVVETNESPVINNTDKKLGANRPVQLKIDATDSDLPTQTLTVGVEAGTLPQGATLANGVISWTPTTDQLGSYVVTLWADDGQKKVTKDITLTVAINKAPSIVTGNQTIDESVEMVLPIETTDPDGDAVVVTSLNLPDGALLADNTVTWTPSETQGGTDIKVTFTADDGVDKVNKEITFTVNKTNSAPYFTSESYDKTVYPTKESTIVIEAKDIDLPVDTLTVGLKAGTELPGFVTFDAKTLTFTLKPQWADAGTYSWTVVADDGVNDPVEKTIKVKVQAVKLFIAMIKR